MLKEKSSDSFCGFEVFSIIGQIVRNNMIVYEKENFAFKYLLCMAYN